MTLDHVETCLDQMQAALMQLPPDEQRQALNRVLRCLNRSALCPKSLGVQWQRVEALEPLPQSPYRLAHSEQQVLHRVLAQQGVLAPLIVMPPFANGMQVIVDGAARWRWAKAAGVSVVPVVEVSQDTVPEVLQLQLNRARGQADTLALAASLSSLIRAGHNADGLAQRVGMSGTEMENLLVLGSGERAARRFGVDGEGYAWIATGQTVTQALPDREWVVGPYPQGQRFGAGLATGRVLWGQPLKMKTGASDLLPHRWGNPVVEAPRYVSTVLSAKARQVWLNAAHEASALVPHDRTNVLTYAC